MQGRARTNLRSSAAALLLISVLWCLTFSYAKEPVANSFRFPLEGKWNVSRGFANTYVTEWCGFHLGEDVPRNAGTPVYAAAKGTVRHTHVIEGLGNAIHIEHQLDDGSRFTSVYYHLLRPSQGGILLAPGDPVDEKTVIGFVSGLRKDFGTGPHLHFGIRRGSYIPASEWPDQRTKKWFYPGYTTIYADPINKVRQCDVVGQEADKGDRIHRQVISEWESPEQFIGSLMRPARQTAFVDIRDGKDSAASFR